MKIALLLTGLMRTYKKTYQSLLKSFPPDKVDIFIETWNILGNIKNETVRHTVGGLSTEKINKQEIKKIYTPKYLNIENYEKWENKNKKKFPQDYVTFYSLVAQYYKVYKGISTILQSNYDIVIRTRFDIRLDTIFPLQEIINNKNSLICTDCRKKSISDYLIASNSKNMKIYGDFYNWICSQITPNFNKNQNIVVEALLFKYLNLHKILFYTINKANFTLIRNKPFPSKQYTKGRNKKFIHIQ